MRISFLAWVICFLLAVGAAAQVSNPGLRNVTTLPSNCVPSGANVVFKTTTTVGPYYCFPANTWNVLVGGSIGAAFSTLTSGTNTTFTGTVGSGATLTFSGTGILNASRINGLALPASAPLVGTNSSNQIILATPFMTNAQTGTYQVLAADFTNYKTIIVASGTFTITLVASGAQPATGQSIRVINYGSGVVTIARSGQNINGGTSSITVGAASATAPTSAFIVSDGTNYFAEASSAGASPAGSAGCVQLYATSSTFKSGCTPANLPALIGDESLLPMILQGYITPSSLLIASNDPTAATGVAILSNSGTGLSLATTNTTESYLVGLGSDVIAGVNAQTLYGFTSILNDNALTGLIGYGYNVDRNGITGFSILYGLFIEDLTGPTNSYYSWFNSQGVGRCREDNTFNSVGQSICAVYNPQFTKYTPGAANYERIVYGQWASNRAQIGTEEGGTGTLRAVDLIAANLSVVSALTPAVTNTSAASCGSTAATIAGNDNAFKVVVGATAGTSCTVTFATAFTNAPSCTVTNETTANLSRATSTNAAVILAGTFVAGDTLAGVCIGR